mgnify:CR=1 FL=1
MQYRRYLLGVFRDQLEFGEVGDVVGTELLREVGIVALDLAGNDHQRRPLLALVGVFDLLVGRLVGRLVGLL